MIKLALEGEFSFHKGPTQDLGVTAQEKVPNTSLTWPLRLTTSDRQRIVLAIRIICSRSERADGKNSTFKYHGSPVPMMGGQWGFKKKKTHHSHINVTTVNIS